MRGMMAGSGGRATRSLLLAAVILFAGFAAARPARANEDTGPVRLARFSWLRGDVTWRVSDAGDWSRAAVNLPLRQEAQVWVGDGGRAELQFDDGSYLRLAEDSVATLQTLYSDSQGEFTEVQINEGLAWLRLRSPYSIYQIDLPDASVKAAGPARFRLEAGLEGATRVAVHEGEASVDGAPGQETLRAGDYVAVRSGDSDLQVISLPDADEWDRWNDQQDRRAGRRHSHLPPNIALVAGNLDDYGHWTADAQYGQVWVPDAVSVTWAPYRAGQWCWVEPFGWTWVSEEPWGWAPFHYGAWCHGPYGWGWAPGPERQYWAPGVVSFVQLSDGIAWCPLAPSEVAYPSTLSVGFRHGDWSTWFSIGGAAAYFPHAHRHIFEPVAYGPDVVNRINNVSYVTVANNTINNYYLSGRAPSQTIDAAWLPGNARVHGAVTQATFHGFGESTRYRTADSMTSIERGRLIGAPRGLERTVSGPLSARPTLAATTPGREFSAGLSPAPRILARPVFRAPLPAPVAAISQRGAAGAERPTSGGFHSAPETVNVQGAAPGLRPASPVIGRSDRATIDRPGRWTQPRANDAPTVGNPSASSSPDRAWTRGSSGGAVRPVQPEAARPQFHRGWGASATSAADRAREARTSLGVAPRPDGSQPAASGRSPYAGSPWARPSTRTVDPTPVIREPAAPMDVHRSFSDRGRSPQWAPPGDARGAARPRWSPDSLDAIRRSTPGYSVRGSLPVPRVTSPPDAGTRAWTSPAPSAPSRGWRSQTPDTGGARPDFTARPPNPVPQADRPTIYHRSAPSFPERGSSGGWGARPSVDSGWSRARTPAPAWQSRGGSESTYARPRSPAPAAPSARPEPSARPAPSDRRAQSGGFSQDRTGSSRRARGER